MVSPASMACSRCSIRARRSGSARTFALILLQDLCPLMAILLLYVALLDNRHIVHPQWECSCRTTPASGSSCRHRSGGWQSVEDRKQRRYVCSLLAVEAPSCWDGVIL